MIVGKKGFGPVQVGTIILVALFTVLLFLTMLFFDDKTVDVSKEYDRVYREIVLDNLLASPVPEKGSVAEVIRSGASKEEIDEVVRPILNGLDQLSTYQTHWRFLVGTEELTRTHRQITTASRDPGSNPIENAQLMCNRQEPVVRTLETVNGAVEVKLSLCESRALVVRS